MLFITSRGFVFVVVAGIGLFGFTFISTSAQAEVTWNIVGTADGQQDLIGVVTTPDPPFSCTDTPVICGVSGTMTIAAGTLGGPGTTIDLAVDPGTVFVELSDPPGVLDEVTPADISKAGYTCSSPSVQTMQCTFDEAEADFVLALSPFNLAFSADGAVESKNGGFKFPDGSVQTTATASPATYAIGDRGPAGGFVFYVTADRLHGLEAAPVDQGIGSWGCTGAAVIPTATNTSVGTGARNTDYIIGGCPNSSIAAALASDYISPSGYFDWYLPSKDELELMYDNIGQGNTNPDVETNVGGFADDYYWSSSEGSVSLAWLQQFSDGNQYRFTKDLTLRVRAVRAF